MYSVETFQQSQKSTVRMDPDCAICHAPATVACDCEAKGLEMAVKQAEARMMQSIYNDIRSWVRAHAQDYILDHFRQLTERRKTAHATHLDDITAHAWQYYQAPPHPNQLASAQAKLKRGIDEDWQASVQRYPEVLEYFYSLVELTLPDDGDASVKDPPLNALSGPRRLSTRTAPGAPATVASGRNLTYDREIAPMPAMRRTPPPIEPVRGSDRRTPGPRERRHSYRAPHPGPPTYYPQQPY
ncbi:hypothetical protein QBC32DRAFT_203536 [Pseudoneurospora amorphoporcata]|uniref:Uncharacterized protein n=1 Tax=Pseudoneurospora amorphoporcata TaxID=241081 RepID=A0AAN6SJQ7_9PEZI|nr:hypothetical protein QBC32DRAFT_203536 [Pseudoneurospora amorphoporcata]